ncbi:MAG: septum formation protein Maf [Clostridia bacterium]|nr:septum formation protein Maf [Clostridia bacterium]
MADGYQLVLASGSPRRRELLTRTGLRFLVDAPEVDEHTGLGAAEAVAALSRRKALAGAKLHPGMTVLGADTLVAVDGIALGKPIDQADAERMLKLLSGRWHQVYTGVCAVSPEGECFSGLDTSEVHFTPLSDEEIAAYIAGGEPMDKAGAYALQGTASLWIDGVRGCPTGIIGLPLPLTLSLLRQAMGREMAETD